MSYVLHVIPHDCAWDASLGASPDSTVACVQGTDRPRVTDWFVRHGAVAEGRTTSTPWDVVMHGMLDALATRVTSSSGASLHVMWHVTASDLPQWQLRHTPDALSVAFFGWLDRARTLQGVTAVLYVIPAQHGEWWPHHACISSWQAVSPIPLVVGPPAGVVDSSTWYSTSVHLCGRRWPGSMISCNFFCVLL